MSREGIDAIPQRLRQSLRADGRMVTQGTTPATFDVLEGITKKLDAFREAGVTQVSLEALEQQRRTISNLVQTTTNATDAAALRVVKSEWDNAVDDVWETALRSGDPQKLAMLKQARAARAEFGRRFQPDIAGRELIDQLTTGGITADEAVAKVLGTSQVASTKAIPYLKAIKEAAGDEAGPVMSQFRAAHFANLV